MVLLISSIMALAVARVGCLSRAAVARPPVRPSVRASRTNARALTAIGTKKRKSIERIRAKVERATEGRERKGKETKRIVRLGFSRSRWISAAFSLRPRKNRCARLTFTTISGTIMLGCKRTFCRFLQCRLSECFLFFCRKMVMAC